MGAHNERVLRLTAKEAVLLNSREKVRVGVTQLLIKGEGVHVLVPSPVPPAL